MNAHEPGPLPDGASASFGLARLAGGVFRTAAAIAAVICCSRFYLYLIQSGTLDSRQGSSRGDAGMLFYAGPAILTTIVKLAVGLIIIGSCGWGLALLVRWAADGLRTDQDA